VNVERMRRHTHAHEAFRPPSARARGGVISGPVTVHIPVKDFPHIITADDIRRIVGDPLTSARPNHGRPTP
jgi:hypothetical protein